MPEFTVKVVLPEAKAAELQDLGAMLKVSTEDVLASAVMVGLSDWEAIEGQLIVDPPGRLDDSDLQLPRG